MSAGLKRLVKIFWARVRLNCYLLRYGMWRGERWFASYCVRGRLIYLATVTGSLKQDNIRHVKVFYDEGGWTRYYYNCD
jgi:hypothetical protein